LQNSESSGDPLKIILVSTDINRQRKRQTGRLSKT